MSNIIAEDPPKHHNYECMSIKELRSLLTLRGYDCSQCLEKSELLDAARKLDATDYDDEARKLFRSLNLQQHSGDRSRYSNLDAIWKHPQDDEGAKKTGGSVYVGNCFAASDRRTLRERNIVGIVNCQDLSSQNYFQDEPGMHYHRFAVSQLAVSWHTPPLEGGFQEAFDFVQGHIEQGNSVLIHCLAGAHRAGAVGTAWLMYKTGKGVDDALALAKACRPIISPFGTLLELLHRLKSQLEHKQMTKLSLKKGKMFQGK